MNQPATMQESPARSFVPPQSVSDTDVARRFGGVARLYGGTALERFGRSTVCVIGVGGVGSWVGEALARSGIGAMTLIDMDHVAESNINRQVMADDTTLGMAKIEAMRRRIAAIHPGCRVHTVDDFVSVDNTAELVGENHDFVVDCADNFRVKAHVIAHCRRARVRVISVGGAGGRIDPSLIRVADLSRTEHDPLLARVRKQLRARYGFTRNPARRFDVPCVYSAEQVIFALADGQVCRDKSRVDTATGLSCAGGLGSVTHVTASMAFMAVARVLKTLAVAPCHE